jgi:hypothetical protein
VVILAVLFLLFTGLVAVGFSRRFEKNKTDVAIARINSTKITLDDVMGKYLPKKPDQALNDSTVAGIDANNNFIRDDVELAIFEKYPNSAKIRAAELQYAQALQLELTQVFNSESLIQAIRKESYAYSCLGEANDSNLRENKKIIEDIVINTDLRKKAIDNAFKYMTTYSLLNRENCDISLSSLSN